ncbi:DUF4097 family beta strand repeat-containing protein [Galbibacter mesophilus]|uniref:hypothetical protein n=1 Tax=Galbibacter mesophilus TaxID=379069 RepID=UPI00191E3366|nr:hypothetical protein [Galbibacter mesophilus]MCM5663111.1 hypothetical protein [Galbibacter mesophilus]
MKIKLYKIVLLFICIPLLSVASGPGWNGKYTKEKKIKKEFKVSPNALLKLNNSYGNLYITSWTENRTVIEVHIKTNSNNEDKAQKKLDEINVEFQGSSNLVSAKTIFEKSGWSWGNNNVSMEINYTVKVPVGNTLDLNNDYGGIYLDESKGVANIRCDYGKLEIGSLHAENNSLKFDYTSKSTIEFMKSGKINADYSSFEINEVGNLTLNADYTNSEVKRAKNVEYTCDYGSIKIEKANNISGSGDYLTTRFGTVHGNVNVTSDYGSIRIEEMAADAGDLQIKSDYTGIKVGYNSNYHFDFKIDLEYAGLSGDTDFNYTIKRQKSTDNYYEGYYGSKGKNQVSISTDYGGVSFYRK